MLEISFKEFLCQNYYIDFGLLFSSNLMWLINGLDFIEGGKKIIVMPQPNIQKKLHSFRKYKKNSRYR